MWLVIALMYLISLLTQHHYDGHVFYLATLKFLRDGNPYAINSSDPWVYTNPLPYVQWYAYPPLMIYIWSIPSIILNFLGMLNEFTFRAIVKGINLIALLLLYKLVRQYTKDAKKLILINPLIIFVALIHGMIDIITALFVALSLYYLENKNRPNLGWILMGLALLTKQNSWPIFPLLVLYKKDRRFLLSLLVLFVGILPFLLISPKDFLFNVLKIHMSRPPASLGYSGIPLLFVAGDASSFVLANVIGPCVSKAVPSIGIGGYVLTAVLILLYIYSIILAYKGEFKKAFLISFIAILMFNKVLSPQNLIPYLVVVIMYNLMPKWAILGISTSAMFVDAFLGTSYSIIGYVAEDLLNMLGTSITIVTRELIMLWNDQAFLYLRIPGLLGIVFYNIFLLGFIYRKLRGHRKGLLVALYLVYVVLVMNAVSIEIKSGFPSGGEGHVSLWLWSNPRFGYRGGDYIKLTHLPKGFPYWDFTYPILLNIAKWVKEKGYGTIWLVYTEDKSLLYLYEVTLLALNKYGLKYAWLIVLPRNIDDYLYGWASTPSSSPNEVEKALKNALRLTPIWINQKLDVVKNKLELNITWKCPLNYVTQDGKPVIYVFDPTGRFNPRDVRCDCVIRVIKNYDELNPLDDYYEGKYLLPLSVLPPRPRWMG